MIRSVWFYFSAVVLTLWHGGIVIVAGLLGIKHGKSKVYDNTMHRWGRRVLRASGVRYSLVGMDNIPDGPVVFISNHQSMFDIFLLATAFPHDTRFVAKKELMKIPVFGRALVGAGNITIDRHNRQAAF
ncbi:MAG: lysophospholipid acyltransferase family protein, partial [Gemmatimonadales bacterium]